MTVLTAKASSRMHSQIIAASDWPHHFLHLGVFCLIVLANNECLCVGMFEGHFSFILPKTLTVIISHRKM